MITNPYWPLIKAGLVLVLVAGYSWWLYDKGHDNATQAAEARMAAHLLADREAEAKALQAAREAEQRHARQLAEIAEQHERDKRDAAKVAADVAAGLRAGNHRLRAHWRGCEATGRVSGEATSAALADAGAAARADSAGRIIGAGRQYDDWIRRLQDVIRSGRE